MSFPRSLDPTRYKLLLNLVDKSVKNSQTAKEVAAEVQDDFFALEGEKTALSQAAEALRQEFDATRRHRNVLSRDEVSSAKEEEVHPSVSFIAQMHTIVSALSVGYLKLWDDALALADEPTLYFKDAEVPTSVSEFQNFSTVLGINRPEIEGRLLLIMETVELPAMINNLATKIVNALDSYYSLLHRRHSVDGIQIHENPIATDVAISIFENVDSHGEIQEGKKADEISAYSVHKAALLINAVQSSMISRIVRDPKYLGNFVKEHLENLFDLASRLRDSVEGIANETRSVLNVKKRPNVFKTETFSSTLSVLSMVDPQNIVFRDKTGLLSADERHALKFRNDSLKGLAKQLTYTGMNPDTMIKDVLRRKQELREYNLEVNSFYVCKISAGNPFLGEAPGALTIIPGIKPNVALNEVVGQGFEQIEDFIKSIQQSTKWHDLFIATSPSKTADKSNALLIGPQGCGKSEVLRAVGGDRKAIGVYAQPSDFLTCWKGEAEKNPKRLFEASLALQKESGKQVYILIDEVDSILNDDHARGGFGSTNLTTEFQQLMDGILQYPHIAVWAATNHPERIPMPMIRRFSKVAVVGQLTQEGRVKLLQQFIGYLPISDKFNEVAWSDAAKLLEGAVGDGIRKVADHVWRTSMSKFVQTHPTRAEELTKWLNEGDKFSIAEFNTGKRKVLQSKLREYLTVDPESVMQSIQVHLDNVAFRAEVMTAVETYERANQFLAGIKAQTV